MNWTAIGTSFQKANIVQRQRYALNEDQIRRAYQLFKQFNIQNALILSTCNRTEFFVPSTSLNLVIKILSEQIYEMAIEEDLFHKKEDEDAILYFFRICSGLESQIAGDFEILGQVRKSCRIAKEESMLSGTWERTINSALSAAKKARTHTGFYSGASSTSYASIEHLKNSDINLKDSKYLILGTGKIGSHTVDHLLKFVSSRNITLANRSHDKAMLLSQKKELQLIKFEDIGKELQNYDVIICATNAPEYIVTSDMFTGSKIHHIVDLSVPMNVDPSVNDHANVHLINVDELSRNVNLNLLKRDAERENVEKIIESEVADLQAWYMIKSAMPILSDLKKDLDSMKKEALSNVSEENGTHSAAFLDEYTDELFHQLSQGWIRKVRNKSLDAH